MKKTTIMMLLVVTALLFLMSIEPALAQLKPGAPPPPVSSPEVGRYVATPIGGGIVVLLSMLSYGIYKLRRNNNQ